ncbi:ModD protein [Niveispirillum sp. SYP-B3756]|uniref:ModD protein n=1 Tax=Niveispirillum sp. SYP-B3756 TaxID=2662178 RepID=UPI001292B658|nr:ModD protein [Niveispirillum sp. SYP-B3756]MQP67870.1 ModD protein [Niveispirillum sp. SYP-B3756]
MAGPSGGDPWAVSDAAIERLLEEDLRFGDLTTRALGIGPTPGRMLFQARMPLVLAGVEEAARMLVRLGITVGDAAPPGSRCDPGRLLLTATGPAAALHAGWKAAQTLMEWSSGIATATRGIVDAAQAVNPHIAVLCTRKSAPFTRQLALKAIQAGGGDAHRLGLSDTILLFPEHRVFLDPPDDLGSAVARLRWAAPGRSVMVEVTSEAEALAAADALVDVIQLEKFPPERVDRLARRLLRRSDGRPLLAAAGGINAANAGAYAKAGADIIVTSAPYNAMPTDIQVTLNVL